MEQYLDLLQRVVDEGVRKPNRTGIDTIGIQGAMMQFDLADGFPAVTTKELKVVPCFMEMLGFLRGYNNAELFRELGCNVWNANANENEQWLNNPKREGKDDLGEIYGVQARRWDSPIVGQGYVLGKKIDQLRNVYDDLRQGIDNRREIVTHWNPGKTNHMALPPCHLLYQFGIQDDHLNMAMYQRSCDMPLGVPFNIAGYAWLLSVMARITGFKPGVFTHFLWDVHIYINQLKGVHEQLSRVPHELPQLLISPAVTDLEYLESYATSADFTLQNYNHEPTIHFPFAV